MKTLTNKHKGIIILAVLLLTFTGQTIRAQLKPAFVDFDAYQKLVAEVKEHRSSRLITATEFVKTSKEQNVVILDTRSDSMYAAVHVKGAIHLNFSDFTQENLDKLIPSPDCKILIYCNNNFETTLPTITTASLNVNDFSPYFVTKMAMPMPISVKPILKSQSSKSKKTKSKQKGPNAAIDFENENPLSEKKPLTLALNIPTYINLYGYGYKNVYELSELVNVNSGILEFEGTAVKR